MKTHPLARALSDAATHAKTTIARCDELRAALEDLVSCHFTDAHPKCPPHDEDDHRIACCGVRRAKAVLLDHDISKDPCGGFL